MRKLPKLFLLTFALFAFIALVPIQSHASGRISTTRLTARDYLRQAGRDTTANEVLDSILTRPDVRWRRADLSPKLSHRIHLSAAEVPRFPLNDSNLMDPRNWPASMTIEGVLCSLTVHVYAADGSTRSRSVQDTIGAIGFDMYYTDGGTDFRSDYARHRGPSYYWLKGRLKQRSWTKGRGGHSRVRIYWPYPSGELFTFMEDDERYDEKGEWVSSQRLEESFARDGTLIGCCVSPVNRWGQCGGYWLGVDVGTDYYPIWGEALERSLE